MGPLKVAWIVGLFCFSFFLPFCSTQFNARLNVGKCCPEDSYLYLNTKRKTSHCKPFASITKKPDAPELYTNSIFRPQNNKVDNVPVSPYPDMMMTANYDLKNKKPTSGCVDLAYKNNIAQVVNLYFESTKPHPSSVSPTITTYKKCCGRSSEYDTENKKCVTSNLAVSLQPLVEAYLRKVDFVEVRFLAGSTFTNNTLDYTFSLKDLFSEKSIKETKLLNLPADSCLDKVHKKKEMYVIRKYQNCEDLTCIKTCDKVDLKSVLSKLSKSGKAKDFMKVKKYGIDGEGLMYQMCPEGWSEVEIKENWEIKGNGVVEVNNQNGDGNDGLVSYSREDYCLKSGRELSIMVCKELVTTTTKSPTITTTTESPKTTTTTESPTSTTTTTTTESSTTTTTTESPTSTTITESPTSTTNTESPTITTTTESPTATTTTESPTSTSPKSTPSSTDENSTNSHGIITDKPSTEEIPSKMPQIVTPSSKGTSKPSTPEPVPTHDPLVQVENIHKNWDLAHGSFLVVSAAFLLMAIFVYIFVEIINNLYIRFIFCLLFSQLFHNLFMGFSDFGVFKGLTACNSWGYVVIFCEIAVYTWMVSIFHYIYRSVKNCRSTYPIRTISEDAVEFYLYSLFSWGLAAAYTISVFVVDYVKRAPKIGVHNLPNINSEYCWFPKPTYDETLYLVDARSVNEMAYRYGPILILCLPCIILIGKTYMRYQKAKDKSFSLTADENHISQLRYRLYKLEMSISYRMFLIMLMPLIFELISNMVLYANPNRVSYVFFRIFYVGNVIRGVYVFALLVWNIATFVEVKKSFDESTRTPPMTIDVRNQDIEGN